MARPKILILDSGHTSYEEEKAVFGDFDCDLVFNREHESEKWLHDAREASGILLNLAPMKAESIAQLAQCRVIARYGVGYDNVDVEACTKARIWVAHCRNYCNEETSDQAMGLLLACVRAIAKRDRQIHQGVWTPAQKDPVFRFVGKTVLVLGFGGSGQAFVRKIRGFLPGEILVCDPTEDPARIAEAGARKATLEEALPRADIVSLHLPLKKETRYLFQARTFASMKRGAILINTSRGPIVHQQDLIDALKSGALGAAGIDVYEQEPLPADHAFRGVENVVLSDHMGWYSLESFSELKTLTARNVLAVLTGGKPIFPVNRVV